MTQKVENTTKNKKENESIDCCSQGNCCGLDQLSAAKLLRHIADFFDSKEK
ncbi:MAG: hypothetical protein HQL68_13230 [Magnetococcales bacterium]|nr:hypothetical protein [Magnetococcales bacterium]